MSARNHRAHFEQEALPHLNSAYNLARWLTRNEHDAEEIVQDAYLRAFRSFDRFRGGNPRAWLLKIVRNVYYTRSRRTAAEQLTALDEDLVTSGSSPNAELKDPEDILIERRNGILLRRALETLSPRHREVLILRELEGMSYKEISIVMEVPTGTVMSTLSRARIRLRQSITETRDRTVLNRDRSLDSVAPDSLRIQSLHASSVGREREQGSPATAAFPEAP